MSRKPRTRRRGHALMLVMLQMALIAALWGIAYRQLTATTRFLSQFTQSQTTSSSNNDGYRPLARALSLLETGDPPGVGPHVDGQQRYYTCNATILTATGPAYFTISYAEQPGGSSAAGYTWIVTSTQSQTTPSDPSTWDNMPSTFGTGN